ncbi:MAG: hypothetical protein RLZZ28_1639, partial [Bacteroidota bacterium]
MKRVCLAIVLIFILSCKNKADKDSVPVADARNLPQNITRLVENANQFPDSISLRFKAVDALDSMGSFQLALAQMDSLLIRDSL